MIKLRWEEYLGLSEWVLNAIISVLMRERDSGRLDAHRRKGNVTMEAEIGVMWP